jgi:hypothetical protein
MVDNPKYRVEREIYQSRMNLPEEADAERYHAVSGLAVAALLLGLLAPIVLVSQYAWVVTIAGLVVSVAALRRIAARAPALLGRKAALVGLALSVAFFTAVPTEWLVYRKLVRGEARQFAAIFFDYLRTNQPQKAHQLTIGPMGREALSGDLWMALRKGTEGRMMFDAFLGRPAVRALVALGDKAKVRYYDTETQWFENDTERVYQIFAVTYPGRDGLKTFFVGLLLDRTVDAPTGHAYWQVSRIAGGVKPKRLGGDGSPPRA